MTGPAGEIMARGAGLAAAFGLSMVLGVVAVTAQEGLRPAAVADVYARNCASCHGPAREGGFGPALSGPGFEAKWRPKGQAALETLIRQTMPPATPGHLSPADYRQLAALLLPATAASAPAAAPGQAPKISGVLDAEPNHDTVYQAVVSAHARTLAALSPVTDAMLAEPPAADWLAVRRTYDSQGFSPLDQINRDTVRGLQPAWALALPDGTNNITPLVHDGVIFVDSSGTVEAVDARSGDVLWTWRRVADTATVRAPMSQPRGLAIHGDRLIVPTLDSHLIALDIHSGKPVWDTPITADGKPLQISAAPIVVRGKVIQGMSGCSRAAQCFVVALDAVTGKEAWRVSTIARAGTSAGDTWAGLPDDQRFGGSIWSSPSYDPVTNLIYVGAGQTYHIAPLMNAGGRANAALYTDSTLAIDPDTGRLVWHYQHMQRDVWDFDWAFERMVMTLPTPQGPRRVVATMGKLGILDVLDARTGAYLFSHDLGVQSLVTGIDPKTGRKQTNPALEPSLDKVKVICPYATGARNWPATSFDPRTSTLYVPYMNACMNFLWKSGGGVDIAYGLKAPEGGDRNFGGLAAIDVAGRASGWKDEYRGPAQSSVLATAGGIVFDGGRDRTFRASDSRTGQLLWQFRLDQAASATPVTFAVDGVQYVAVTSGAGNPNEVTSRPLTPEIEPAGPGVRLWVFKLGSAP